MKEIVNEKYKHSDVTGKIIGCAMKVHSTLGNARLTGRAGFPGSDLSTMPGDRNGKAGIEFCKGT